MPSSSEPTGETRQVKALALRAVAISSPRMPIPEAFAPKARCHLTCPACPCSECRSLSAASGGGVRLTTFAAAKAAGSESGPALTPFVPRSPLDGSPESVTSDSGFTLIVVPSCRHRRGAPALSSLASGGPSCRIAEFGPRGGVRFSVPAAGRTSEFGHRLSLDIDIAKPSGEMIHEPRGPVGKPYLSAVVRRGNAR